MSAKDKPISRPMSQQFADNYDRIFNGTPPVPEKVVRKKDRVDLGLSPSTIIQEIDCTGKGEL